MKKLLAHLVIISLVVLGPMFVSQISFAFDNKAHTTMSERATDASSLDNFLKTVLRYEFPEGLLQPGLAGKSVTRLIQDGTLLEDSLHVLRVLNHFHNPELPWDQAGLWPPNLPTSNPLGDSSVVWSQNANQGYGGKASWHQAREAYFEALTATDPFARKVRWAETFRFLGHAIHHIQDAAAPSHTRNDSHLPGDSDQFHSFAERAEILALINNQNLLPASSLDPSFLGNQPSPDSRYPVPIARLLDTTAGNIGATALGNGNGIGVAEYSNANFFSDDTIFPETFSYPGLANLQVSTPELDPGTGTKKIYLYFKPGFGETNYRLAQASALRKITNTAIATDIGLDYKVFTDYAFKLFPRAIGYSAGLIDYFFRGKIDSTLWPTGYLWVPWDQRPSSIRVENVSVKTDTTNEQGGGGTMQLVLLHSWSYAPVEPPKIIASHPVSVGPGTQTIVFPFDSLPFPSTFPSPTNGSHGYVYFGMLVYKGALGQESEAVVADSYCIDPNSGFRYDRWYVFEHAGFLDGEPIESAYMSEC